ncbi:MAG: DUF1573 domain-containing protein [Tannerella sp.]|jgi:hypothetical protein|nr:DUF1573 domain-containing protein [Tannerella sp.]
MNKVKNRVITLIAFLALNNMVFAQNPATNVKATFTIDKTEFDYGNIPENGGLANHTFIITNTGANPLVVKQVVASCGCTTPDWTREPIAPDKTGEIKVAYNPKGRFGTFAKNISVYCENADPVHLTIKGNVEKIEDDDKPQAPIFTPDETSYDFGTIGENDGFAEHIFKFKNTGNAPLTVTRVHTSCGCTKPEWTQSPIEPGQEGIIIITFSPKGRIGNFNKQATVYTNENGGYKRHKLIITGNVVEKPSDPYVTYIDTIGGVGIEEKDLTFKNFNPVKTNRKSLYIKNYNTETVYFSWENVPDYIAVTCPDSLKADWPGEISIVIDGTKTSEKRGRIKDSFGWIVKNQAGKVLGNENITATVNYVDDFNTLSPLQSVNAAHLEIKNSKIQFENIKRGFLGFGGTANKEFILTNTGRSDLTLYSVSSDDSRIHLPELNGKIIKAGESLTVKVTVKAKETLDSDIDNDIYVICNDPKGPIRMIKVITVKTK